MQWRLYPNAFDTSRRGDICRGTTIRNEARVGDASHSVPQCNSSGSQLLSSSKDNSNRLWDLRAVWRCARPETTSALADYACLIDATDASVPWPSKHGQELCSCCVWTAREVGGWWLRGTQRQRHHTHPIALRNAPR